jgi:hypothetical protein
MSADEFNALQAKAAKRSKFGNHKVEVDGIKFDSKAEGARYWDLKLLAQRGEIRDLELQPRFPLLVQGVKVAEYRGDFAYYDVAASKHVVEDVKSAFTRKDRVYRLKKKMVAAQYGIQIVEVGG